MLVCSQCDRPAVVFYEDSELGLCVDCFHKLQQANALQQQTATARQNSIAELLNFNLAQMELQSGLPFSLPRYQTTPNSYFTGNVNNIQIDRSVVGSVNTGNINELEIAMNNINAQEHGSLAEGIKNFTEAVLKSDEIDEDAKEDIIEQLAVISEEAGKSEEQRKQSVLKTLLVAVKDTVSTSAALSALWVNVFRHFM